MCELLISRWNWGLLSALLMLAVGCADADPTNELESSNLASPDGGLVVLRGDAELNPTPVFENQAEIENSVVIGLDADMTSAAAQSGEAIRRGVELAIDEINANGGLLGRPIELVIRDHRGNPDRGIDNMLEFAEMDRVVAVVGGLHTPVALRELDVVHQRQLIYLGPWAAGTPIVANGREPNYVFRVSVRDEFAGGFLVRQAVQRGLQKVGLILERTGWGRSNEQAIKAALDDAGAEMAVLEWMNLGDNDLDDAVDRVIQSGADVVLLVSNPLEGAAVVRAMAARERQDRRPIISHWGITGANFPRLVGESLYDVDLSFLQTHSFIRPQLPGRSDRLFAAYASKYSDCVSPRDIASPVGVAHAYDIVKMLAVAVEAAGTTDRPSVRDAMERLTDFPGVIRDYAAPFDGQRHDALTQDDFILARYSEDGSIEPLP